MKQKRYLFKFIHLFLYHSIKFRNIFAISEFYYIINIYDRLLNKSFFTNL